MTCVLGNGFINRNLVMLGGMAEKAVEKELL